MEITLLLEQIHAKFVDDMILAVSLKLKETLTEDPNPVHLLSYYERTVLDYHLRMYSAAVSSPAALSLVVGRLESKCVMQNALEELRVYSTVSDEAQV